MVDVSQAQQQQTATSHLPDGGLIRRRSSSSLYDVSNEVLKESTLAHSILIAVAVPVLTEGFALKWLTAGGDLQVLLLLVAVVALVSQLGSDVFPWSSAKSQRSRELGDDLDHVNLLPNPEPLISKDLKAREMDDRSIRRKRKHKSVKVVPAGAPPSSLGNSSKVQTSSIPNSNQKVNIEKQYNLSASDIKVWDDVYLQLDAKCKSWIDDDIKVRFIRGSAFIENMKKREAYLKKRLVGTCEFRERYQLPDILKRQFPHAIRFRDDCWRMKIYGNDAEGNPIVYLKLSEHHYKGIKSRAYGANVLEYMAYHQESLMRAARHRSARSADVVQPQYTLIFDLASLSWRLFKDAYDSGFFSEIAELWSVNYPETIRRIYVINAPFILTSLMPIVSPFIEPDTMLKLRIVGQGYANTFREDKLPASSIPVEIGGQCEGTWILAPEQT